MACMYAHSIANIAIANFVRDEISNMLFFSHTFVSKKIEKSMGIR